jgi:transcriptional regulator with XRE-family HTH domain
MTINSGQSRAARGLLDWTQTDLAEEAGLGLSTVLDFERNRRIVSDKVIFAIQQALESAGVKFIPISKSGGPGVRLKP